MEKTVNNHLVDKIFPNRKIIFENSFSSDLDSYPRKWMFQI